MAGENRVGGIISFAVDGVTYSAKGNFTWNLGRPKREAVIGATRTDGYKESAQTPFIEGEITIRQDTDVQAILDMENGTVTLETGTGKVISLTEAWFAGEGTGNTEEGNMAVRFEGLECEEIS